MSIVVRRTVRMTTKAEIECSQTQVAQRIRVKEVGRGCAPPVQIMVPRSYTHSVEPSELLSRWPDSVYVDPPLEAAMIIEITTIEESKRDFEIRVSLNLELFLAL
jgi:hypothetical protein